MKRLQNSGNLYEIILKKRDGIAENDNFIKIYGIIIQEMLVNLRRLILVNK